MTDRELMQQALDALDEDNYMSSTQWKALCRKTCTALRARLAQPEPEPVARVDYDRKGNIAWLYGPVEADGTLLYTAPPQREWQGLTDDEIHEVVSKKWWDWEDTFDIEGFSRAIETKLKEKNA